MRHGVTAWLAGVLAVVGGLIVLAPSGHSVDRAAATFPVGWTRLPAPPSARDGAALVWTGSELIAWGGCGRKCAPTAGGFAFDPAERSWERIPAAPLAASSAEGFWTGEKAIFLHPVRGRLGGQAYDPRSREWRVIPSAPLAPVDGRIEVWTGAELIVWGGGRRRGRGARRGAAYDPARDAWRPIARGPTGLNLASGIWTGRKLVVFGSLLDGRNVAETRTSVGAAYDPASDSWRELPPSRLSAQATSAVWLDGRIVAWDYELRSQEYDPDRNRWADPLALPLDFSECYPDSVVVRERVFAFFCGQMALYDGRWRELGGGPPEARAHRHRVTLTVGEGVVFLSVASADSLWVYRPPD